MTEPFPKAIAVPLGFGTLLSPLNSSMVAVALITIMADFDASAVDVSWVVSAFYLGAAVGQPVMGGLADRFGPRRIFVAGMAMVVVSGALGPFAPNLGSLIAVRVLLAIGTSAAFPAAVAVIRALASSRQLDSQSGLGTIAMASVAGAAGGPIVGGLAVHFGGWQAVFWINVPMALIAAGSVWRRVPPDGEPRRASIRAAVVESDPIGIVLFSTVMVTLLLVVTSVPTQPRYLLLPVTVAGVVALVWWDRKVTRPFLDLRALRASRALMTVYAQFVVFNVIFYAGMYGIPQWLEVVRDYSPAQVGFVMLPLAALGGIALPLVSRLIRARGSRFVMLVGSVLLCVAAMGFLLFDEGLPIPVVLVTASLFGISSSMATFGLQVRMYSSARPAQLGVAAGLFQTSRYLGGIISITLLGLAFSEGVDTGALFRVATITVGLSAGLVLLSARARRHPASPEG